MPKLFRAAAVFVGGRALGGLGYMEGGGGVGIDAGDAADAGLGGGGEVREEAAVARGWVGG